MFITPAYAQAAGGSANETIFQLIPFVLIFIIMYFLILRPQQQKVKAHKAMVDALRRGDQVTLSGGLIGRISKVIDENTLEVELGEGVKIKCLRGAVAEVRTKGEPADKA
jgi:preprotein translocase subunit YajC